MPTKTIVGCCSLLSLACYILMGCYAPGVPAKGQ